MSSCQTCIFYKETRFAEGFCRRYPPMPVGHGVFQQPIVMARGTCGEHVFDKTKGDDE